MLYTRKRYALVPFLGNSPYAAYILVIYIILLTYAATLVVRLFHIALAIIAYFNLKIK